MFWSAVGHAVASSGFEAVKIEIKARSSVLGPIVASGTRTCNVNKYLLPSSKSSHTLCAHTYSHG